MHKNQKIKSLETVKKIQKMNERKKRGLYKKPDYK